VRLLFITRKWEGTGGMQRLARDQWRLLPELGCEPVLCAARSRWDILFPLRAALWSLRAATGGWRVHLGDAALAGMAIPLTVLGLRVTVTACGLDVTYPHRGYQRLVRAGLRRCARVVCISHATASAVAARGVAQERIVVIPCGIWPEDLPDPPARRAPDVLLTVGRLIPRKGVRWFLETVLPSLPAVRYRILGAGPDEPTIRAAMRTSGAADRITLQADATDDERDRAYAGSAALVVPNIPLRDDPEGFGIVCIEAAARGVPVIAADLDGLRDAVLPGRTGVLFAAGDPGACRAAVVHCLDHPLPPVSVAREARAAFSWHALADRYRHALLG
jgi:phosphatidylinositol alpha-1,6-mannosyltransferase